MGGARGVAPVCRRAPDARIALPRTERTFRADQNVAARVVQNTKVTLQTKKVNRNEQMLRVVQSCRLVCSRVRWVVFCTQWRSVVVISPCYCWAGSGPAW